MDLGSRNGRRAGVNKMRALPVVTAIAATLVACTGAQNGRPATIPPVPSGDSRSGMNADLHVSYPVAYGTLGRLKADADAVVVAHIADIVYQGPDPQDHSLPLTQYRAVVEEALAGDVPSTLLINQTAGAVNGLSTVSDGDPVMAVGDRYVLYLHLVVDGPAAGVYFIIGGPQGRLAVAKDGSLHKVGESQVAVPANLTLAALEVSKGQ